MNEILVPYISVADHIEDKGYKVDIDCVPWSDMFSYKPRVYFYIGYTHKSLCIKYFVAEKNAKAICTQTNGPVWTDSCVELFVQVPGSEYYYNFETNCIGVGLSAKQKGRGLDDSFLSEDNGVVRISSFEKRPIDIVGDSSWTLYLEIPFSSIGLTEVPNSLLANFYKCGSKTIEPHFLSWNPIIAPKPDFHRPEFFGTLRFVK